MKKEKYNHCNLCQKNLTNSEFFLHLTSYHFPPLQLKCERCNLDFISSDKLNDHNTSEHSHENLDLPHLKLGEIFLNIDDVIKHVETSSNWIKFAFSNNSRTNVNKREMRSHIKNSFNDGIKSNYQAGNFCDTCIQHKSGFCLFCPESFSNMCYLKQHILNAHLQLPDNLKKLVNLCESCTKVFPSEKHLSQHQKREHKSSVTSKKAAKSSPFCQYCNKMLANKSNLKRHVLNQHSEEVGTTPHNPVFTCDYCKCYFSNKSSVKRHIENLHLKEKDTKKSISCFQCKQRFNSIKNLNAHLTIEHKVDINEEKLQFSNLDQFWKWKQGEEIQTNSRFIQLRGLRRQRRKGEEVSTLKFVCNRSGIFHSKSNGKRAYRIKGSSKIGRYCSSYIEIMFKEENSSVNGTYCSTHSGHDNDLRYLALSMNEKREIYEKIQNGSTFSTILNEIRNSVGKEIKRKHLVTNKDLHNIVTTFKKLSKDPHAETLSEDTPTDQFAVTNSQPLPENTERIERVFHNDLDIGEDLWVETCQRMVDRLDPAQASPKSTPETNKRADAAIKATMKDVFVVQEADNILCKSSRMDDFNHSAVPFNINFDYSPGGGPSVDCMTPPWNKPANFPIYQEDESRLNIPDMSYYNNVSSRPLTSHYARKEVADFCGPQEIPYPAAIVPRLLGSCTSSYDNSNTSIDENVLTSMYLKNDVNDYNKLPTADVTQSSMFVPDEYILAEQQTTLPNAVPLSSPHSPESLGPEAFQNDDLPSDGESGIPTTAAQTPNPAADNQVSDLRDRVNSVTALYNIVESELDENKKNIIRKYVDDMFKVLQYRYNKCKSKRKPHTQKRTQQQSLIERKLNRRRRVGCGSSMARSKTSTRQKVKQTTKQQKQLGQYPCVVGHAAASKNINSYSTSMREDPGVAQVRPEINMLRWEY